MKEIKNSLFVFLFILASCANNDKNRIIITKEKNESEVKVDTYSTLFDLYIKEEDKFLYYNSMFDANVHDNIGTAEKYLDSMKISQGKSMEYSFEMEEYLENK